MHIIFGNFGNETIALMQFAFEKKLQNVFVVSIDTGFADENWYIRISQAENLAKQYHFNWIRLTSNPDFSTLIRQRQQFPSKKFQWCVSFLKGITINAWLDEIDSDKEAILLQGKRKSTSKLFRDLNEFEHDSEYYDGRSIWYPLLDLNDQAFKDLVLKSGLEILSHRSLECDPCIHSSSADFARLSQTSINRVKILEQELKQNFFALPIEAEIKNKSAPASQTFHLGCGSPYVCGE